MEAAPQRTYAEYFQSFNPFKSSAPAPAPAPASSLAGDLPYGGRKRKGRKGSKKTRRIRRRRNGTRSTRS